MVLKRGLFRVSVELSTLLLVAVAIAVSVAVALWASNIAFYYTGFEMLDVSCRAGEGGVTVTVRNRGTRPVTLISAVVEGEVRELGLTLRPGEHEELSLPVKREGVVQVEVRTPGKVYPCVVEVRG
ncbi:MAG: hypothetical protein QW700_08280 [Desulfurococcaceae archaeon]